MSSIPFQMLMRKFLRVRRDVCGNHLVAHARAGIGHAVPADGFFDFPRGDDAALLKLPFPIGKQIQFIEARGQRRAGVGRELN